MALTPQFGSEINTTSTIIEIPSKTYKLDINDLDNTYAIEDYRDMVYFEFDNNGNLIAIPRYSDPNITFEIVTGDLMATSNSQALLNKYSIQDYYMMFETNAYSDRIMGYVDNLEAVKQAVYHILMTERYAYLIYSNNYGIELNQYIGRDFNYLASTIEQTLRDALTYDLRITNVVVDDIKQPSKDIAEVIFTVYSIYGNLQMGVNISV